ncbi:MAG TPA: IS1182 family transposase [Capsulimonadaceae bacterium]|jgi:transposase
MQYRDYPQSAPLLFGYDPERDLPSDHLARFIDGVVDETILVRSSGVRRPGQPRFDPRLCIKVLIYGYATGLRSSRQLEKHCREHLAYLYLTRGDTPSYRTLCTARLKHTVLLNECWVALFAVAKKAGIKRLGRIDVDSTKIKADVSSESVVKRDDFAIFEAMLREIITQAEEQDLREDAEGYSGQTQTGMCVGSDQMREVIRSVRRSLHAREETKDEAAAASLQLGPRMLPRLQAAVAALEEASLSERKHLSLTDPDAQMMKEGRTKHIQECHALEVATDNGLLVCAQSSQSPTDANRLLGLVSGAEEHEPDGIKAVTADTGYYGGDNLVALAKKGIDTCIPDSPTARDMRRGLSIGTTQASISGVSEMTYDADRDCYWCKEGRMLRFVQQRKQNGAEINVYRALASCGDCPIRTACMKSKSGKHRMLKVPVAKAEIQSLLARFGDDEHQQRYHNRGKNVETVFGFIRTVLNVNRWFVRGKEKIEAETALIKMGFQVRKVHRALANHAADRRIMEGSVV